MVLVVVGAVRRRWLELEATPLTTGPGLLEPSCCSCICGCVLRLLLLLLEAAACRPTYTSPKNILVVFWMAVVVVVVVRCSGLATTGAAGAPTASPRSPMHVFIFSSAASSLSRSWPLKSETAAKTTPTTPLWTCRSQESAARRASRRASSSRPSVAAVPLSLAAAE